VSVGRFLVIGAAVIGVPLACGVLPLYRLAGGRVAGGVAAGALLAALGALVWLACLKLSWGRGNRGFLGFLFGGILVRLVLMGAATVAALVTGAVHMPSFVASMFVYYVVFQILEIRLVRGVAASGAMSGKVTGATGAIR
jgi:hypothetical protein